MSFGEKLQKLRRDNNLTRDELVSRAKLPYTPQAVYYWEKQSGVPARPFWGYDGILLPNGQRPPIGGGRCTLG